MSRRTSIDAANNDATTLTQAWCKALNSQTGSGAADEPNGPAQDESLIAWARRVDCNETEIARAAACVLDVEFKDNLANFRPAMTFLQKFPIGFARQHGVLVLLDSDECPFVATSQVDNRSILDNISRALQKHLTLVFVPEEEILRAINKAYEQQNSRAESVLDTMSQDEAREKIDAIESRDDLLVTSGQSPVVDLVNTILLEAVKAGASDVHFQPYRDKLVVRFRIDGVLFDAHPLPKDIQEEILSRVKVMGKMDIAEKRLPQDGRSTVTVGDRLIDLRIASLPGSYGERVVLRLLDKSTQNYSLDEVGMNPETQARFQELIQLEHGLILLTGPTGSGKTTTLYAALQDINTSDRNVVTLEDPIEYDISGISQTQINVKKGLTFASGLRNVLRQDPDIIMVGEIRDQETAVMAIQSALTGHLVFSTLHTNDAASAVTRLLDLGIEPYLVSSSLLAVLAQRLVRKVCPSCSQKRVLNDAEQQRLAISLQELDNGQYTSGDGCPECRETGYRGRVAICELLAVDEPVRGAIQERANATDIRDVGCQAGMTLLRDDGIQKIRAGVTTPAEVARVTVRSEN